MTPDLVLGSEIIATFVISVIIVIIKGALAKMSLKLG